MRVLTFAIAFLLCIPISSLQAQFDASFVGSAPRIDISPRYPTPFSTVRATLNDYSTDTGGAVINWRVNGTAMPEYQNQRSIDIPVGDLGQTLKIEAAMVAPNGYPAWAEERVTPVYLDLVVEPQTTTPYFYQGRALPSVGSTVNVTALVNAGNIPRSELIYYWYVNNSALLGGAARAQNQVSFTMPQGGATVRLEVERVGQGTIASKSIELVNTTPFLRFYEINNLYGALLRPVTALTLLGNSTTVRAEPYHLDSRTYNNPDLAEWSLSGNQAPTSGNPYEITLVRQFSAAAVPVGFHVRNTTQILQGAQGGFTVQ